MFQSNRYRNLYILSAGELAERFCYYGTQTVIVLYLVNYFRLSDHLGYEVFAVYAAFAAILPFLGGVIADRYININTALIGGMLLLLLGNLVLVTQSLTYLYLGLALTLLGTGLYKSNIAVLVGRLFPDCDIERQRAYTIFYAFINIGGASGPITYGILITVAGWQYCFILNMIVISIGLIWYLLKFDYGVVEPAPKIEARSSHWLISSSKGLSILATVFIIVAYMLHYPGENDWLFVTLGIAVILYIGYLLAKNSERYLAPFLILLFLCLCVIAFYALSLQVASSVSLYIDQFVDRKIYGWEIPTIMFAALYPASVIVMVMPMVIFWRKLDRRNIKLSSVDKFCCGLGMLIFAFIAFSLSVAARIYLPETQFIIAAIVIANLFLGIGEICIVPVLLSAISKEAPKQLQGTFIGIYYIASAFGGFLSGQIAQWSGATTFFYESPIDIELAEYFNQFLSLIGVAATLFLITLAASKIINRL